MRNGERAILAVLNLCVRNEIRTNDSVIDNTQVVKSVSRLAIDTVNVRRNHQLCINLRSAGDFFTCNVHKR
jgi:hypothetical protein